ncbi:MAG: hypothetical protein R3D00_03190 [Bacteroidia bacterium]
MKPITSLYILFFLLANTYGQKTIHDYPGYPASVLPSWGNLGGENPSSPPTVLAYGPNRLAVFRHEDDEIFCRRWDNNQWSGWEPMGWNLKKDRRPSKAVSWGSGRIDVFTTSEGNLYHTYWQGGWWGQWEQLGGGNLEGDFDIVSWGEGRLDIFARTADGNMKHLWWENGWGEWEYIYMGSDLRMNLSIRVVTWGYGRLDIFAIRKGHDMIHSWYENGWGSWENLGGINPSHFDVVTAAPNQLDIIAEGPESGLWHLSWAGNAWNPWSPMFFLISPRTHIQTVSRKRGTMDVFVRGLDDGLYHLYRNVFSGDSTPFENLGGKMEWGPSATAWGPERLDVIVVGTDQAFYHLPWDGIRWGY